MQLPLPFDRVLPVTKPKPKPSPVGKPHPDHPDFFHLPCHGNCPGHTAKRRRSRTRTKRDVECRTRQVAVLGYMTTGGPNRHVWGNYPNVSLGGARYIRPWVKVVIRVLYALSNRALIPKAPLPVGLWRKLKGLEAHILVLDNGCIQKRYKQVHSKLTVEWLQMFLAEHGVRL